MARIIVHLTDGTTMEFPHRGRAGGSYTSTVKYSEGFAVITDGWGKKTTIPSERILRVEEEPTRGW